MWRVLSLSASIERRRNEGDDPFASWQHFWSPFCVFEACFFAVVFVTVLEEASPAAAVFGEGKGSSNSHSHATARVTAVWTQLALEISRYL